MKAIDEFNKIIESIENRCMAVDGPVTPTLHEATEKELSSLWKLINQIHGKVNGTAKWHSATTNPPPEGVYVLVKTRSGLVRVAKRIVYNKSLAEEYRYSSQEFKYVIWWQPLPR